MGQPRWVRRWVRRSNASFGLKRDRTSEGFVALKVRSGRTIATHMIEAARCSVCSRLRLPLAVALARMVAMNDSGPPGGLARGRRQGWRAAWRGWRRLVHGAMLPARGRNEALRTAKAILSKATLSKSVYLGDIRCARHFCGCVFCVKSSREFRFVRLDGREA